MTTLRVIPIRPIAEPRVPPRAKGPNDRANEERLSRRSPSWSPGADGDPHMEECAALRLGGQDSDGECAMR